jgi:uncharacterized protein (TIGR02444 family)
VELPEHPFWDFSIAVHARPGVSEACLALQRGYALDVNLLFFCCWAAVCQGRPLGREGVTAAVEAAAGWQEEVVRPVWRARWRLKGGFGGFPAERTEALRKALIAAELDAEHVEQLQLAEAVPVRAREEADDGARLSAAAANLAGCLAICLPEGSPALSGRPPEELVGPLAGLLAGVLPGLEAERIRSELLEALRPPA